MIPESEPKEPDATAAFRALHGDAALSNAEKIIAAWYAQLQAKNKVDVAFMEYRAATEEKKRDAVTQALTAERNRNGPFLSYLFERRREWKAWAKRSYTPRYYVPSPLADNPRLIRLLRSWYGRWFLRRYIGRWFSRKDGRLLAEMLETDEKHFGPFVEAARGAKGVWHGVCPDYHKFLGE